MSQRDNRLAKFVCHGIYHGFVISRLFFIYFIITWINYENLLLYQGLIEIIIEASYIKVPLYGIKTICKIPVVVYYQCCILIG